MKDIIEDMIKDLPNSTEIMKGLAFLFIKDDLLKGTGLQGDINV